VAQAKVGILVQAGRRDLLGTLFPPTDEEGRFAVRGLPIATPLVVTAFPAPYASGPEEVVILPDEHAVAFIRLIWDPEAMAERVEGVPVAQAEPARILEGVLFDELGVRRPGAHLEVLRIDAAASHRVGHLVTDELGRFELGGQPLEAFELVFTLRDPSAPRAARVDVPAHPSDEIEVFLPGLLRVTGLLPGDVDTVYAYHAFPSRRGPGDVAELGGTLILDADRRFEATVGARAQALELWIEALPPAPPRFWQLTLDVSSTPSSRDVGDLATRNEGRRVLLRVIDEQGAGVPAARVDLTHEVLMTWWRAELEADADGALELDAAPRGPCSVEVQAQGFAPYQAVLPDLGGSAAHDVVLRHEQD